MRPVADLRPHYDAIVVGARAAGAATAMLLARDGARVLLVDRQPYGSDTLSTHALLRGAVMQLDRFGLLGRVIAAGTPPVRRTTFRYGDETVAIDIRPLHGTDALYAPRRTVLDAILVDAAWSAGVDVRHGVTVGDLVRSDSGAVSGVVLAGRDGTTRTVRAGIVVGADGRRSTVARLAGAETYRSGHHKTASVYAYVAGLPDLGYQWLYRPGASVGAIPTNGGEQCIFVSMPPERFLKEVLADPALAFWRILAETFPDFAAMVGSGRIDGRVTGFAGAPGHFRQSFGPGWALVGDAGFFKDPLTAHGITDALRDAEALATAVARGGEPALAAYQAERDAISLPLFEATERIASFAWDLDTLKADHAALNRAMKAEVERIAASPTVALAA